MANTKISAFPSGSPAQSTDEYVIARAGANYKLAGSDIKTLVIGAGSMSVTSTKTLTVNNTLTLAGTDGTTMTFPSTSATIARTDAGNTFAGNQVVSSGSFGLSGNISAAAWTTNGIRYANSAATLTDTTSSGTVAAAYTDLFGGNTIAASNATTFTDYYTTWFNAATAGTNVTMTNKWALGLGGNLKLGPDASGTNQAGTNVIIGGSRGTGTGAGGSIIFQVAPAGTTGTAQNALATALTINPQTTNLAGAVFAGSTTVPRGNGYMFPISGSYAVGMYNPVDYTIQLAMHSQFSGGAAGAYSGFQFALTSGTLSWGLTNQDIVLARDASNTLALRNGANAQESRIYGSYTSATNFQRMSIKTLRESSGALSGASYTTTIAIPAYANLIGVTTRVTTAVTGATSYSVGDGTTVGLWGATIGVALGSQSHTADFTAVGAVGAAATSRTVTLTANGSNFTGGVVEICLHYLTTEAD